MNIQVRVLATQAQRQVQQMRGQIQMLQRQLAAVTASQNAAAGSATRLGAAQTTAAKGTFAHTRATLGLGAALRKTGAQVQWMGRQIAFNLSLPLILAGTAAMKWEMQSEAAMTRLIKVYGDASMAGRNYGKEIKALGRNFDALSDRFGVARADVRGIAADWAAAGVSGVALAKATRTTLETMILGDMDSVKSTESLIAIQAQWGLSSKGLTKVMNELNMVENQTATSMPGLIEAFTRTGVSAKAAGISTRELAAMIAVLTPTTGTAAQAGNGLKSVIQSLTVTTPKSVGAFKMLGINVNSAAWATKNGTERMAQMAQGYVKLTSNQREYVAGVIAGKWQVNKLTALMIGLNNKQSAYYVALNSTADANKNAAQRTRELLTVLNSTPQKMQIYGNILKNQLTDAMVELLPLVLQIIRGVVGLARAFNNLSPGTKKLILFGLAAIAILGPVLQLLGTFITISGVMVSAAGSIATGLTAMGAGGVTASKGLTKALTAMYGFASSGLSAAFIGISNSIGAMFNLGANAIAKGTALWRVLYTRGLLLAFASGQIFMNTLGIMSRFLMETIPLTIARAYSAVYAAALRMYLGISTAWITQTVPELLASMNAWIVSMEAFLLRGYDRILVGAKMMFSAIPAAMTWAQIQVRTLLWKFAPLIASIQGKVAAAAAIVGRVFAAVWQATIFATTALFSLLAPSLAAVAPMVASASATVAAAIPLGWVAAIGVVIAILWTFRKQIWNALKSIPGIFVTVFKAVVEVVKQAALAVYDWFSYLNPFAHHSPSLVENVTAGMDVIIAQYSRAKNITSLFRRTATDLAAFGKIAKALDRQQSNKDRQSVAKYTPANLGVYDKLSSDLKSLNGLMDAQAAKVSKQSAVVDRWKAKLDAANAALAKQQEKLTGLQDKLSSIQSEYDKHKEAMQAYADTTIEGMGAMDDAIFENQMAQKKLQLQILQYQQVNGSIDETRDKMSKLAGDIEKLKGEGADLRLAGAGSDVLGPINDQIDQMSGAYKKMGDVVNNSPETGMQKQLDALQKQAEVLDLTKSITFDPLTRQIDKLVNAQKEMKFDDIIAGITSEKAAMDILAPQIANVTQQIADQQKVVDDMTAARDELQKRYDLENAALEKQQGIYDGIKEKVDAVTDAIQRLISNAAQIKTALDTANRKKPGDKPPGAFGKRPKLSSPKLGREGGLGDQSKQIDELTKGLQDELTKSLGKISLTQSFKDMFRSAWEGIKTGYLWLGQNLYDGYHILWDSYIKPGIDWLKSSWLGGMNIIGDWFVGLWDGVSKWVGDKLSDVFSPVKDVIDKVIGWFQHLYDVLVGHSIIPDLVNAIGAWVKKLWTDFTGWITKLVNDVVSLFTDLGTRVKSWWNTTFMPFLSGIGSWLLDTSKGFLSFFAQLPGKIFSFFTGAKDKVVAWWTNTFQPFLAGIGTWMLDTSKGFLSWFAQLPGRIMGFFSNMKDKVSSWWSGTAVPFFSGIAGWFTDTGAGFLKGISQLPGRVLGFFSGIKDRVSGFWNDKMKPFFSDIASWFTDSKNGFISSIVNLPEKMAAIFGRIPDKIKGALNSGIDAINGLIDKVNGMAGKIGIKLDFGHIPHLASGGAIPAKRTGAGYSTSSARAVVGEGSNQYPEYVIPTDPKYRDNAMRLLGEASATINNNKATVSKTSQFNAAANASDLKRSGGVSVSSIASDVGSKVSDAAGWLTGHARELVAKGLDSAISTMNNVLPNVTVVKSIATGFKDKLVDWIKGKAKEVDNKSSSGTNGDPGSAGPTNGGGTTWPTIVNWMRSTGVPFQVTSTTGGGHAPGSYHYMGRAADLDSFDGQNPGPGLDAIYNAAVANAKNWAELIYGGPASGNGARSFKNGAVHNYGAALNEQHKNHVHIALAKGGITAGAMNATIGEKGREAVVPLNEFYGIIRAGFGDLAAEMAKLHDTVSSVIADASVQVTVKRAAAGTPGRDDGVSRPSGGDTTIIIQGDLSFPNISNGSDAEDFIKNLKGLG